MGCSRGQKGCLAQAVRTAVLSQGKISVLITSDAQARGHRGIQARRDADSSVHGKKINTSELSSGGKRDLQTSTSESPFCWICLWPQDCILQWKTLDHIYCNFPYSVYSQLKEGKGIVVKGRHYCEVFFSGYYFSVDITVIYELKLQVVIISYLLICQLFSWLKLRI